MRKSILFTLVFLCFQISLKAQTDSTEFVQLGFISEFKHVADQSAVLEVEKVDYSFEEIITNKKLQQEFVPQNTEIPYKGFTADTYWVKFKLENIHNEKQKLYLEVARPLTNIVNLYILSENGQILKKFFTGDEKMYSDRPIQFRNFLFPIQLQPNEKLQFYLELSSDGEVLSIPLKLWNPSYFEQFSQNENFMMGMYYGLLSFVILLFSFFGFVLKQRLYAFFVSYVVFLFLLQFSLDGLAFQYLWSNLPWWANHAVVVFATVSVMSLLIYVRVFLDFKGFPKKYVLTYNLFLFLLLVCLVLSFTSGSLYALSFPMVNLLAFLSSFLFLVGIYIKYKKVGKVNIYFVLAFFSVLAGGVIFILCNTNILKSDFLMAHALKLGSGMEVIFLSIAMAFQYREVAASKDEVRRISLENLKQLAELKRKQNVTLEKEVKVRTKELMESNESLSKKNTEIIESITYAQRLQDAVLPKQEHLDQLFPKSFILNLPKDIVSGDFYWAVKVDMNTFFAVADCTGHGVPGAMISVLGNNALSRCVNEFGLVKPSDILDRLTELIEDTLGHYDKKVADGMDICLCKWDGKNTLEYAGANNPLYIVRENELIEFKSDKQPIGSYFDRKKFTNHTIQLKKGDYVYLSTDGYADQFGGPKDKKFMYGKFKKLLVEIHMNPQQEQKEILENSFIDWKEKSEQVDDVCVLGVGF